MKLYMAVLAATLLTGTVSAQSLDKIEDNAYPLNKIRTGVSVQNSATQVNTIDVNAFDNVSVLCLGSAATTSVSIALALPDGNTTSATTVNCTTTMTQVMSFTAGANAASGIVISPTAGLTSTNTVRTLVVRKPSIYRQ